MPEHGHIHDDDLELYSVGHLEPERLIALEAHLSRCQECRERLKRCVNMVSSPEDLKRSG
jgi:anti-sigma factor RsiW